MHGLEVQLLSGVLQEIKSCWHDCRYVYYNNNVVKPEQLFNFVKKRDRPVNEVAAVVARTLPQLSKDEIETFAVKVETEAAENKSFRDYWTEVLTLAYEYEDFKNKMTLKLAREGEENISLASVKADMFIANLTRLINDCVEGFCNK